MTKDDMATEIMRLQGDLAEARGDALLMTRRATALADAIQAMIEKKHDPAAVMKLGKQALSVQDRR